MSTMSTDVTRTLVRSDYLVIGGGAAAVVLAALTRFVGGGAVPAFLCSALAVTLLASLVARSVEQLGDRFGPGATGVLQSALGNLPELFIALFALRAGLVDVVKAALIGSILANLLLVLGLCFVVGGLRHGTQKLDSERARSIIVLMVLSVAALLLPSLAHFVHAPASQHENTLSLIVSGILLLLFALTLPASLRRGAGKPIEVSMQQEAPRWPIALAVGLLALAALLAAFVSEWFVHALEPAMQTLHISDAFAGLVIVALIVTIAKNWLWGLDFFHVVGGSIWITIDLFMGLILGPILARMSIPARMELTRRLMPKMMVLMPPVVIATLTAGYQLARRVDALTVPYPQHWWLTASYIVVGLMALIAYGVMEPANILVLLELRKPQPNGALIARSMRNFIYSTAAVGVLQISIAIIMTRIATSL